MSAHAEEGLGRPVTTATFRDLKTSGTPIAVVTAYDAPSARLADAAGADALLVGDSLGMTVLGLDSTLPVTMDDMLRHTAAVVRGATRALVIADMPFMSFQVSPEDALRNAGRFLAEAGASAVKLEGGLAIAPTVARLVEAGVPVMGHVGLTPQSVHQLGGYKAQAKETGPAVALIEDCLALQAAGAFSVVLECIPAELAALVTEKLAIATIGIGAGRSCDGQVQVLHDLLGLGGDFTPRHARRFAEVGDAIKAALSQYVSEVRAGSFPGDGNSTHMEPGRVDEVRAKAGQRREGMGHEGGADARREGTGQPGGG